MFFRFYKQLNTMDCGPTCIRMVAKYYGRHYNADTLRRIAGYNKEGVSLLGISETAEKIGFRTRGVKLTFEQLKEATLPAILHWNQNHFVVAHPKSFPKGRTFGNFFKKKNRISIADPARGFLSLTERQFKECWLSFSPPSGATVRTQNREKNKELWIKNDGYKSKRDLPE